MIITWIGHSCFKIEKDGFSIVFDPYQDEYVPGLKPVREEADIVICSHEHGDHSARECVKIKEETVCPFIITQMDSFHDDKEGELRGENKITIIDDGNIRISHFGDQGCMPTEEIVEELMDIDIALIPVGGHYTIDGKEAAEIVKRINAKTIIPMHFKTEEFGFDVISTVDDFVNEMGGAEFTEASSYDIEAGKTGVIVLKPKNA